MNPTPHDSLVRALFGQPSHAAAELEAVLPPEVLGELDLATLPSIFPVLIHQGPRPFRGSARFVASLEASVPLRAGATRSHGSHGWRWCGSTVRFATRATSCGRR